jgi:tripartite-type tricarboxylate transporter receptor subunit TctC
MQQTPTQGGGPAMTAALGNHVALLVSHPGVAKPHTESGAMRALASLGAERAPAYPEVPSLKELG